MLATGLTSFPQAPKNPTRTLHTKAGRIGISD